MQFVKAILKTKLMASMMRSMVFELKKTLQSKVGTITRSFCKCSALKLLNLKNSNFKKHTREWETLL